MTSTVGSATFDILTQLGVTTLFGNPGSTELTMFRDMPEHFRYILGLQESVVVAMADGFAQASRNASFVNLHSAAGTGHALGAIFGAYKNQAPMIVTAGQQARSILPFEPFLYAERAAEFPRPYVKWAIEPARAQDVPAAILQGYHIAMQPPRGPVFISVPIDDWDQPCAPLPLTRSATSIAPDPQMLDDIAQALATARRPAFVVGAGVARDQAWHELIALAERHQASVFVATMASRNAFPENHPLFMGFLTAFRERIVEALAGHDIILVLGAPAFIYHAEGFGPHVPEGAKLFQIVDDPKTASWIPEGTSLIGSLKPALTSLLAGPAPAQRSAPASRLAPARLDGSAFTGDYVLQQIQALRPADSVIVEEAPSHRARIQTYIPITQPDGFFTTASGGLGHAMPAANGVALARPGTRIIAIVGDGSAMYAIQALFTAAQLKLPISFIIMNNRRYEALHVFGRHFGLQTLHGTDLSGLDFVALAKGHGMHGVQVSEAGALDAALQASFASTGPSLIELLID
jgi:benzoylformate decarboxylase